MDITTFCVVELCPLICEQSQVLFNKVLLRQTFYLDWLNNDFNHNTHVRMLLLFLLWFPELCPLTDQCQILFPFSLPHVLKFLHNFVLSQYTGGVQIWLIFLYWSLFILTGRGGTFFNHILAHLAKDHVSFCHHLASVVHLSKPIFLCSFCLFNSFWNPFWKVFQRLFFCSFDGFRHRRTNKTYYNDPMWNV